MHLALHLEYLLKQIRATSHLMISYYVPAHAEVL
uniref:Uncharacterized protein n=1 Tax=Arundo donax TaxID=35708 RepID=A0A0A9AXJ0_ARUDO